MYLFIDKRPAIANVSQANPMPNPTEQHVPHFIAFESRLCSMLQACQDVICSMFPTIFSKLFFVASAHHKAGQLTAEIILKEKRSTYEKQNRGAFVLGFLVLAQPAQVVSTSSYFCFQCHY